MQKLLQVREMVPYYGGYSVNRVRRSPNFVPEAFVSTAAVQTQHPLLG